VWEALAVGILLGIISGLIPGIHTNTFAAFLIAYAPLLSIIFSPQEIAIVIFANAVTHTFLDIIPSVFLGIPDEDTAIAVLPAHEMVLDGKGFEAVSISAFSSLFSFLISLPLFALFILLLPDFYEHISKITLYFLLIASIFLILTEKGEIFEGSFSAWRKRCYALFVFLVSGFLGYVSLKYAVLAQLNLASSVFLPLLTGLFASPTLIVSIARKAEIPKQLKFAKLPSFRATFSGSFAGMLVSLFPGVSSGVATVIASAGMRDREKFVSALSAANTSNAFLCFAILLATYRVRSGAADAFSKIVEPNSDLILPLVICGVIAALISTLLTLLLASFFASFTSKSPLVLLSSLVFSFLIVFVYLMTGTFGVVIFAAATPIGLSTLFLRIRRVSCMGCLMLPAMLFRL
jgi:putative membrane protein